MENKLQILGAAQAFGFGGISEMCAIEGALRIDPRSEDCTVHMIENTQFKAVVAGSRQRFQLHSGDIFDSDQFKDVDVVVPSYDTAAVFYGWFNNLPVYFYDGMLWFWDFEKYEQKLDAEISELESLKASSNLEALKQKYQEYLGNDFHFTVLIAYHLAKKIYARGALGVNERVSAMGELGKKIQVIGAMIDPLVDPNEKSSEGEHVLVTLSGSLAPTLSFEQNMVFARGALAFAREAHDKFEVDIPFIFSCHPKIFEQLTKEGSCDSLPNNFKVVPSFPYEENLRMIRDAYAVFASPGFSTVQEAAHFRTPLFFLPEQNGGQPTGFQTLKKAGYPTEHNLTVTDKIYGGDCNIGDYDTPRLYRNVGELWSDEMAEVREGVLRSFVDALRDKDEREALTNGQREAVSSMIGGFDGAREMVNDLLSDLLK